MFAIYKPLLHLQEGETCWRFIHKRKGPPYCPQWGKSLAEFPCPPSFSQTPSPGSSGRGRWSSRPLRRLPAAFASVLAR